MAEFIQFAIGIALLTLAVIVISLLFGGVQLVMGKYGFQIVFGAFLAFVGWIAYGAYKSKK